MIIEASAVRGLPVVATNQNRPAGRLSGFLVETTQGRIKALVVKNHWWQKARFIKLDQVKEYRREAVLAYAPWGEYSPSRRVEAMARQDAMVWLGRQKVLTKSRQSLGRLINFTFDNSDGLLVKIISGSVLKSRTKVKQFIISREQIITIEPRIIVVQDAAVKQATASLRSPSRLEEKDPVAA